MKTFLRLLVSLALSVGLAHAQMGRDISTQTLPVAAGSVPLSDISPMATNTLIGNATSGTASPAALAVGTCSTASSALIWTTNTGFGCNTAINAGTLGSATFAAPGAIGGGTAAAIAGTTITANTGIIGGSGHVIFSATAPSIASGFGSSPSVVANNGTAAFTVNVGTGGTASAGVITMPAATTGWACMVAPNGAPQGAEVTYSAPTSTTSITLTSYTLTTGIALAWTSASVLQVMCKGY